ncbi:MAG: heme NO-binding domain-containing protein [Actinomycetota bacterium]|nr:heme NO-binding domain-containing protein [Actinomycetota bacterium]
MKGIIFNLAEEVVRREHGEDTWDAILLRAGLDGSWTSLGSYPDEHLERVVTGAAALLGTDERTVLCTVAEGAIPLLAVRYPHFFTPHTDTRAFVLTLNDMIHPEVRKVYPGATPPVFGFESAPEGEMLLSYTSARRLCALAEGFVYGAAKHYGQPVVISQPACMLDGASRCLLRCRFTDDAA